MKRRASKVRAFALGAKRPENEPWPLELNLKHSSYLFVESYPQVVAGQQRTLAALLATARRLNLSVAIAVPASGAFATQLENTGYETVIWPQPALLGRYGGAYFRDGAMARLRFLGQSLVYVWRIWRELRRMHPQAVFCNDMRGLLTVGVAGRLRGIPVMIWDKLDKPHGVLDWFQVLLVRSNPVISWAVTAKYPAWQRRLFRDRMPVVPNGVDVDAIEEAATAQVDLGIEGDPIVGIVGTVTPRKGHDRLLSVWSRLLAFKPNARLLIAGAPESDNDRSWAGSLPNRDHQSVAWLGQRDDVPAIMGKLDVLVVPSRHEGMGRVCAEAMAAGVPVLGARTGGIPEVVVDGETGLLFEPDDSDDLLEKLVALCQDTGLRRKLGAAGRVRARTHFDQRKQHEVILNLLEELGSRGS